MCRHRVDEVRQEGDEHGSAAKSKQATIQQHRRLATHVLLRLLHVVAVAADVERQRWQGQAGERSAMLLQTRQVLFLGGALTKEEEAEKLYSLYRQSSQSETRH